jgi:hypothetical protein
VAEELIPITMFLVIGLIISSFFWFRYRARGDMQQTIRTAIDKGQELTPELIDRLGSPQAPKDRDLRNGLIWLALAAGLALCGWERAA